MYILLMILMLLVGPSANKADAAYDASETLVEAYQSYKEGENAKTIVERKEAFNKSLKLYTQLEDTYNPEFGNGKLFYNIANSYFQVEQYPWSILYYLKALKLMPRSDKAMHNLAAAQQKAGVPVTSFISLYDQVFYFHSKFSLPERLRAFFILGLILLGLISLSIWRTFYKQKTAIILASLCFGAMFISVAYTLYFSPIQAVVIHATPLYKDAGTQYATVTELPIIGGNVVQILEIRQNGEWLKIFAPSGDLGYVPQSAIRII